MDDASALAVLGLIVIAAWLWLRRGSSTSGQAEAPSRRTCLGNAGQVERLINLESTRRLRSHVPRRRVGRFSGTSATIADVGPVRTRGPAGLEGESTGTSGAHPDRLHPRRRCAMLRCPWQRDRVEAGLTQGGSPSVPEGGLRQRGHGIEVCRWHDPRSL